MVLPTLLETMCSPVPRTTKSQHRWLTRQSSPADFSICLKASGLFRDAVHITSNNKRKIAMNKALTQAACVGLLAFVAAPGAHHASPQMAAAVAGEQPKGKDAIFTTPGMVQCAPGKKATIAPVQLHPVVEVCVAVGARVKKDQILVKLDDEAPKADRDNKRALLEGARILQKEAER